MIDKNEMLKMLDVLTNEDFEYATRLEAYEFLLEDCEEIIDEMLERFYKCEGDTAQMLLEIMANYPGNKSVFMALVSYLYRGEDVALFAKLLGKYGDLSAIQLLEDFANENDLNYNEMIEIRNAIEELGGGGFVIDESKYTDDMFYRYVKGLDEEGYDDRKSPFEDILNPIMGQSEDEDDEKITEEYINDDDCHCDADCHCHDNDCHCHEDDCHCDADCQCHDNDCHCHEDDED